MRCLSLKTVGGLLLAALAARGMGPELRVRVQSGVVEGKSEGPVRAFLGIPYAAPPLGDLRWKPPAPAIPWEGIRKAVEFGPRPMQPTVYADMAFRDSGLSEDCLSLNIWTPAKDAQAKLPVMIWIFGGGYLAGGTSEQRQDGKRLAERGVVVVSMNYRLGVFGFFTHPELIRESPHRAAGNYGLLDQLAAIRWVRANIAGFGGDPANVTIFGESAGSISISALMASPLAKGLFQKAIGESGSALSNTNIPAISPEALAAEEAEYLGNSLGVRRLAGLRALPAQTVLDAASKASAAGAPRFYLSVDGYFLPEPAARVFAEGRQNDVPLLAGWNHDEQGVALEPADTMAFATWAWLEAQSKSGRQPIFRYRFDRAPPADPFGRKGVYHSADIFYVFGSFDALPQVPWTSADREAGALIQSYWTNFARTGDPNGKGLPRWPRYSPVEGWPWMRLDSTSAAQPVAGKRWGGGRLAQRVRRLLKGVTEGQQAHVRVSGCAEVDANRKPI